MQKCLLWHRSGRRQIGRFFDRAMSSAIGVSYHSSRVYTSLPWYTPYTTSACLVYVDCYTGNYYSTLLYIGVYTVQYYRFTYSTTIFVRLYDLLASSAASPSQSTIYDIMISQPKSSIEPLLEFRKLTLALEKADSAPKPCFPTSNYGIFPHLHFVGGCSVTNAEKESVEDEHQTVSRECDLDGVRPHSDGYVRRYHAAPTSHCWL